MVAEGYGVDRLTSRVSKDRLTHLQEGIIPPITTPSIYSRAGLGSMERVSFWET
jgi:hypothetical protein